MCIDSFVHGWLISGQPASVLIHRDLLHVIVVVSAAPLNICSTADCIATAADALLLSLSVLIAANTSYCTTFGSTKTAAKPSLTWIKFIWAYCTDNGLYFTPLDQLHSMLELIHIEITKCYFLLILTSF